MPLVAAHVQSLPLFHEHFSGKLSPELASMVLKNLDNASVQSIAKLARLCPNMRVCVFERSTESAVAASLRHWRHSLASISVSSTNLVDANTWAALWECRKLKSISIHGSVAAFPPSAKVEATKVLELDMCSLQRCKGASLLACFPNLERLSIRGCTDVPLDLLENVDPDWGVHSLDLAVGLTTLGSRISGLRFMETLVVPSGMTGFFKDGLPPTLKTLDLRTLRAVPDDVYQIPHLCPQLAELKLPTCSVMSTADTNELAAKIFSHLPLVRLNFEGFSKLTDTGMHSLSCRRDTLVFLSLAGTAVTNASLRVIGEFVNLEELFLNRTPISSLDLPGM